MAEVNRTRVAVLMGGHGAQRAESLESGLAACIALRNVGFDAVEIDVNGSLPEQLLALAADVVLVALRGQPGADGTVQGLLQALGLPYVGSGVLASALAADRLRAKDLLHYRNIPTPSAYCLTRAQALEPGEVAASHRSFPFPAVVKPRAAARGGGARTVRSFEELVVALALVTADGGDALVERHVAGREIEVALLDGRVLGTVELEAAAETGSDATPDGLSRVRLTNLAHLARGAYRALDCRGAACVRFICPEQENDIVLAVDTAPLLTDTSTLVRAARQAGLELQALCFEMVRSVLDARRTTVDPPIAVPPQQAAAAW